MQDNSIIDLTAFFSDSFSRVLMNAGYDAKQNKHEEINQYHLLKQILYFDPQVQQVLSSTAQLNNTVSLIESKIKSLPKWKTSPEKIEFSKEVKLALLRSLDESLLLGEKLISPLACFLSLSRMQLIGINYQTLIKSLNLTQGITLEEKVNYELPKDIEEIDSYSNEYVDLPNLTNQIIRLLYKDTKKNILIVGNDGIGKKSTRYLLAKQAQTDENIFSHSKVFSLDFKSLTDPVSINQKIQALEQDLQGYQDPNTKLLLYITNIDIASNENLREWSIITPLFDKLIASKLWGIIPMNYAQYQNISKQFPTLLNESDVIYMDEPDNDTVMNMIKARFASYPDIAISEATLHEATVLAHRFVHDTFMPKSVINLLDEAISQARIDNRHEISPNDIKKILSQKTGIPLTDITSEEIADLQNLEAELSQTVIGQDEAVASVTKTIKRSRAGLKDPKRPIGSFLFIGPSGTGKTQLAKALAKIIYKDENAMIRIDMSEYTDAHTVDRLIGAPPGFVGYEEGGQLTNKVLKKPYSLILLDEVEKANPKVFDIFLQVLDDGRLTDGQGKTVDFKNTIIIMTSNLVDEATLTKFFRPEFLNRIDQIIHFKPLTVEVGKSIVNLFIKDLKNRLEEKSIHLSVTDDVINKIASEGISDTYGARPLKRLVEEKIEDPIVEKIINGEIKSGDSITWNQI